ncbi:hypothetical protein C8J57DRAFT_1458523 [Mycena rebaudengoi]|nr:hypothetical protein C8J57DRAFT_1458523 [Mycena rebaudengoi]
MEYNVNPTGGYNFPSMEYMVPQPGPYIPPGQFYAHLLPGKSQNAAPDAPEAPAQPSRKRVASVTQLAPPVTKRQRGRPRGSTTKAPSAPRAKAKPKAASSKSAKSAGRTRATKENTAPPAPLELSDSDSEIESSRRHWTGEEKTDFFKFLLAKDEQGDKRFEQHQTDPSHVYKRASEILFKGSRSPASIKSLWTRSLDTYMWMHAFESFTRNGGGDGDCVDDPQAILKTKMSAARKAGVVLGSLKPATITEWENNGWYDLFDDRLGTSARVSRTVVRNSASAISDLEDPSSDEEHSSDDNIHLALLEQSRITNAATASTPKTPAARVSEPKHVPSSNLRKSATNSFGNIGELMKMKMLSEEKRATALEQKLDLERQKLEFDKTKGKVEMARAVLGTEGVDDDVKMAANSYLKSLFV